VEDEIEKLAISYAGANFRDRQNKTYRPFHETAYASWTLPEFKRLIDYIAADLPEGAEDVTLELDGGHDETASLKIEFVALESEADQQNRISKALAYAKDKLDRERKEYERLRGKFDPAA